METASGKYYTKYLQDCLLPLSVMLNHIKRYGEYCKIEGKEEATGSDYLTKEHAHTLKRMLEADGVA